MVIESQEGQVETRFSQPFDLSGASDWVTVWDTNIGDFQEGTVSVSSQVRGNAGAEWTAVEIRAVGYIGSTPSILATWMLGGAKNTATLPLAEGKKFDRLTFEGRLIVNGTPGAGALTPSEARVSAVLKLWG